jgi:hypothetical protein
MLRYFVYIMQRNRSLVQNVSLVLSVLKLTAYTLAVTNVIRTESVHTNRAFIYPGYDGITETSSGIILYHIQI